MIFVVENLRRINQSKEKLNEKLFKKSIHLIIFILILNYSTLIPAKANPSNPCPPGQLIQSLHHELVNTALTSLPPPEWLQSKITPQDWAILFPKIQEKLTHELDQAKSEFPALSGPVEGLFNNLQAALFSPKFQLGPPPVLPIIGEAGTGKTKFVTTVMNRINQTLTQIDPRLEIPMVTIRISRRDYTVPIDQIRQCSGRPCLIFLDEFMYMSPLSDLEEQLGRLKRLEELAVKTPGQSLSEDSDLALQIKELEDKIKLTRKYRDLLRQLLGDGMAIEESERRLSEVITKLEQITDKARVSNSMLDVTRRIKEEIDKFVNSGTKADFTKVLDNVLDNLQTHESTVAKIKYKELFSTLREMSTDHPQLLEAFPEIDTHSSNPAVELLSLYIQNPDSFMAKINSAASHQLPLPKTLDGSRLVFAITGNPEAESKAVREVVGTGAGKDLIHEEYHRAAYGAWKNFVGKVLGTEVAWERRMSTRSPLLRPSFTRAEVKGLISTVLENRSTEFERSLVQGNLPQVHLHFDDSIKNLIEYLIPEEEATGAKIASTIQERMTSLLNSIRSRIIQAKETGENLPQNLVIAYDEKDSRLIVVQGVQGAQDHSLSQPEKWHLIQKLAIDDTARNRFPRLNPLYRQAEERKHQLTAAARATIGVLTLGRPKKVSLSEAGFSASHSLKHSYDFPGESQVLEFNKVRMNLASAAAKFVYDPTSVSSAEIIYDVRRASEILADLKAHGTSLTQAWKSYCSKYPCPQLPQTLWSKELGVVIGDGQARGVENTLWKNDPEIQQILKSLFAINVDDFRKHEKLLGSFRQALALKPGREGEVALTDQDIRNIIAANYIAKWGPIRSTSDVFFFGREFIGKIRQSLSTTTSWFIPLKDRETRKRLLSDPAGSVHEELDPIFTKDYSVKKLLKP